MGRKRIAYKNASYDVLIEKIKQYLSNELEDEAMTIAQQLEQRGVEKEKSIIAKNLLTMKVLDLEKIAEATNLSINQLKQLQEEIEPTKH